MEHRKLGEATRTTRRFAAAGPRKEDTPPPSGEKASNVRLFWD